MAGLIAGVFYAVSKVFQLHSYHFTISGTAWESLHGLTVNSLLVRNGKAVGVEDVTLSPRSETSRLAFVASLQTFEKCRSATRAAKRQDLWSSLR